MPTSSEIRKQFIEFFRDKCGHTIVPSSPVVPHDDPTLLFANAGMNQFKDVFLGTGSRPYKRAANTQKCIRAGGKHNDLDDVGKDTYHHTFFEMLGNWSFGDYFKKEAITWAWELLTEIWKLDKERLHVTVFEGDEANNIPRDEEAANFWKAVGVPESHIHLGNKKDNFWEMGETGPCGPCTEVHYDHTPDKSGGPLVNQGTDKVIEIWNLVFIQFNRNEDKSLTPLPAQHVDTGMGFERITKVLQGKSSNYDTDIFTPIFEAIQSVTGARPYGGKLDDAIDTAYRVIGDHIRTLTLALTDGAVPSNEGRGSQLRSILRRAQCYGWRSLETKEPFLYKLVPCVVAQLGDAFPELGKNPEKVRAIIYDEEKSFLRTMEKGLKLFAKVSERALAVDKTISGKELFELHTTHGFLPLVTKQLADELGLTIDTDDYDRLMVEFKIISNAGKKFTVTAVKGELPKTDDSAKYSAAPIEASVVGWVKENEVITAGTLSVGEPVALLLDQTCFYGEQGGQVGDVGLLRTAEGADFEVVDTKRLGDAILHVGSLTQGTLTIGEKVQASGNMTRRIDIMRNHTATHLLNLALRRVLGSHVDQKGSLVDDEKTRFDFSHDKPVEASEIRAIEEFVNRRIVQDLPVTATVMPLSRAKEIGGVRAVFGEKYPDPVRVVMIGAEAVERTNHDDSVEFCGGTHVPRTGEIGYFKILEQSPVAKGIRRLTAVTGRVAQDHLRMLTSVVDDLSAKFLCRPEELPARVEALLDENKKLQTQMAKLQAAELASVVDALGENAIAIGNSKLVTGRLPNVPVDLVRAQADRLRHKLGSSIIVFGWADEEKASLLVALTPDLTAKGLKAGDLVKKLATLIGGSGGGKPDMAQAGGKEPAKLDEALTQAQSMSRELLAK